MLSLAIALVVGLAQITAWADSSRTCPAEGSGETAEDCPWGGIARALLAEEAQGRPVLPKLKELAPGLSTQISKDAERKVFKLLWGKSINFDEMAKDVIVHPSILSSIGELFGEPAKGRVVHAGMEHTYGYLFSILKTSFGYKRARWVKPTIEEGLALPDGVIDPANSDLQNSTFFGNVTYLLANIAFRDDGALLRAVRKSGADLVPRSLANYPYSKLSIVRLEEALEAPKPSSRTVVLRTDFVAFKPVPAGQRNSHLLVYSVLDPLNNGARLITAFPVEKSFVDRALKQENLGRNQPIITRYNAHVDGVTGQEHKGTRQIVSDTTSAFEAR